MMETLPGIFSALLFTTALLPALISAQEEITLKSGEVLKGKVLASTAEKLILRLPDGKMRTLKVSEIKTRKKSSPAPGKTENRNPKSRTQNPKPQKRKTRPGLSDGSVRSGEVQGVKFQANGDQAEELARALALSLVNSAKQNKAPLPIDEVTVLENGRLYLRLTSSGARTLQAEPDRYIAFLKHILTISKTIWPKMSATIEERQGKIVATATHNTPDGKIRVEINPKNR